MAEFKQRSCISQYDKKLMGYFKWENSIPQQLNNADCRLHGHVLAQRAMVVQVFPAQRQPVHALGSMSATPCLISSGLRGSAMQRAAA